MNRTEQTATAGIAEVIPASEFGIMQEVDRITTSPRVISVLKAVNEYRRRLKTIPRIRSDEEEAGAVETLAALRKLKKSAEAMRTEIVSWPDRFCSVINTFFRREVKEPLTQMEKALEENLGRYRAEKALAAQKEAERQARELARLGKRLEKAGVSMPAMPAPSARVESAVRTESGTAYTTKTWTWEVTDKTALIRAVAEGREKPEALDVNGRYITGLVRAGVREIPGIRVFQTESLRVKT